MKTKRKCILTILFILYAFTILFCISKLIPVSVHPMIVLGGAIWVLCLFAFYFPIEYVVKKMCNSFHENAVKGKKNILLLITLAFLLWIITLLASWSAFGRVVWSNTFYSFGTVFLYVSAVFYHIRATLLCENAQIKQEAALNMKQIELNFVKTQINPHVLFNHLNNIAASIILDSNIALDYTYKLSEFLRFQLDISKKKEINIQEEVFFIQCFLDIEKLRLGDRYNVDIQYNIYNQNLKIPPLLLYPLIEYAVRKNQINRNKNRIVIELSANADSINMTIFIPYVPNQSIMEESSDRENIEIINKRLQLLFYKRSSLKMECEENIERIQLVIHL